MYFSHSIFSKIWARSSLACAVTRFKVEGLENIPKGTPVIFMPNHQSNLDWLVLWSAIPPPFRFVCKKELFKIPFFGVNLRYGGHFSLDREAKRIAYNTLGRVMEVAKKSSIIIFPEGTRSWDGNLREFKGGGVFAALKIGVPIVPVAISGTFNIMPRNTWIVTPGKVKVKIGKPIIFEKTEELDMENYKVAILKVRESITSMLSESERQES
jgi:1-acyl-sn-glycerol-3-phosphate acyltransferase